MTLHALRLIIVIVILCRLYLMGMSVVRICESSFKFFTSSSLVSYWPVFWSIPMQESRESLSLENKRSPMSAFERFRG